MSSATEGADCLWVPPDAPGVLVRGVFHGQLPTKSNSRRAGMAFAKGGGRRAILRKSPEAVAFVEEFRVACLASGLKTDRRFPIADPVAAWVLVFQQNLRRDLDAELLWDAMQTGGLLKNDRLVWKKAALRLVDRENPRIEFVLRRFVPPTDNGRAFLEGKEPC